MLVTEIAIPKSPAKLLEIIIAIQIIIAGTAVDSMEIANPCITFVAWPVSDDFATDFTGLKFVEV